MTTKVLERQRSLPVTSQPEDWPVVDLAVRRLLAEARQHDDERRAD